MFSFKFKHEKSIENKPTATEKLINYLNELYKDKDMWEHIKEQTEINFKNETDNIKKLSMCFGSLCMTKFEELKRKR